jgi:protein-tyrosine-phosphatase
MATHFPGVFSGLTTWVATWRRRIFIVRTLAGPARRWAVRRYLEGRAWRAQRLAAASPGAHGRVVFVCHGNIMRSAFATQVARAYVPEAAHRIVGAGTHAVAGRAAQDAALAVSRQLGLPLDAHAATPLHALPLTDDDVIVCMDAMNEAHVAAAYPAMAPRVFRVGDIVASGVTSAVASHADREIRDPYGEGEAVTRDAFNRVAHLSRAWVDSLLRPRP